MQDAISLFPISLKSSLYHLLPILNIHPMLQLALDAAALEVEGGMVCTNSPNGLNTIRNNKDPIVIIVGTVNLFAVSLNANDLFESHTRENNLRHAIT